MIEKFYTLKVDISEVPENLEGIFTPAEVMESCCYYFKNYKRAIEHLCERMESCAQRVPLIGPMPQKKQVQNIIETEGYDQSLEKTGQNFSEEWVKNMAVSKTHNPYYSGSGLSDTYQQMMSSPMFQSSLIDLNGDLVPPPSAGYE